MTNNMMLRGMLVVFAAGALAACNITDPQLNTGIAIGPNGVTVQPSVQARVNGGLLTYTPPVK